VEDASKLKHVWLLREVPRAVAQKLRLPDTDQGINLVAEARDGGFCASPMSESKPTAASSGSASRRTDNRLGLAGFTLAALTMEGVQFLRNGRFLEGPRQKVSRVPRLVGWQSVRVAASQPHSAPAASGTSATTRAGAPTATGTGAPAGVPPGAGSVAARETPAREIPGRAGQKREDGLHFLCSRHRAIIPERRNRSVLGRDHAGIGAENVIAPRHKQSFPVPLVHQPRTSRFRQRCAGGISLWNVGRRLVTNTLPPAILVPFRFRIRGLGAQGDPRLVNPILRTDQGNPTSDTPQNPWSEGNNDEAAAHKFSKRRFFFLPRYRSRAV